MNEKKNWVRFYFERLADTIITVVMLAIFYKQYVLLEKNQIFLFCFSMVYCV